MPSKASTITLPGGIRARKLALRGEIVQQFAQCREQIRLAVVAHLLGQGGMKTVHDEVERHAAPPRRGRRPSRAVPRRKFPARIAWPGGWWDRRAKRRPDRAGSARCRASAGSGRGTDHRRRCAACRPARIPTGIFRRSATSERRWPRRCPPSAPRGICRRKPPRSSREPWYR